MNLRRKMRTGLLSDKIAANATGQLALATRNRTLLSFRSDNIALLLINDLLERYAMLVSELDLIRVEQKTSNISSSIEIDISKSLPRFQKHDGMKILRS